MSEKYIKKSNSSENLGSKFRNKSTINNSSINYFYGLLIFVFSFFGTQMSFGQNATQMIYSTSTGASLNNMTGSTQLLASGQDFSQSGLFAFGFTFRYCGVDYTQFSVSSNGVMRLGGTTVNTSDFNSITYEPLLLSPCWDDMHTATTGKVHAIVSGSAPNRILTVEWLMGNYAERAGAYTKTVQVILEETTNIIHFTYGANTGAALASATIGINSTTGFYQCVNTTTGVNTASTTARDNNTQFPASGRRYTWSPPIPVITSFTPTSACVGETINITGTNLSGVTALTIGGTPLTGISSTATTATGTIGSGTTGTVAATTTWGTGTSAATFTVNPLPATPGNPTSNSPQCPSPGVTITRNGVPPAGISWYWQTTNNGTSTANNAATPYNTNISGTYYIRAQNNTTGCWSATSGSVAITVTSAPLSTTPNPANAATNVCYAGTGAITGLSWSVSAGATSYDVYFGAGSLPGTITANVATNSCTLATLGVTLTSGTTYYWSVVPRNGCGAAVGAATWTFTTSNVPCTSCTSTSTGNLGHINNFSTTAGIGNITNNASGYSSNGYGDFTVKKVSQYPNYAINVSLTIAGGNTSEVNIWVDWNDDGTFAAGEKMFATTGYVSTAAPSFTVPAGASVGNHRMRVRADYIASDPAACGSINNGETEDYTFTVVALPPCVNPTSQPTALVLTPGSTNISGSFTAASPAPDNYLVVYNTTGVQPTPVNGTAYPVGTPVPGGTSGDIDGNTTFNITGLSSNTLYYVYVFSYNSLCSGGPAYYNPNPITGSTTTLPPVYCTSTGNTNGEGVSRVQFNTINNTPTAINVAYSDYTAISTTVTKGTQYPINVYAAASSGARTNYQTAYFDWNSNGSFADAGETFTLGTVTGTTVALSSACPFNITIPLTAVTGSIRMRITSKRTSATTASSCETGYQGETEDYTINIIPSGPCTTPIAQPTNLALTPSATSISGTFTGATPAADHYLVVYNTTGTTPTPTNGTTYTVGGAITGGTVGDIDNNTTFNVTGLSSDTLYYFFVFSYNSNCTGGPLYYTTTPLTGEETTLGVVYCAPTTESPSPLYISYMSFVGTLNDVSNTSGYTGGYQNFSTLPNKAKQAQGGGINIICNVAAARGRWKGFVDWNKDGDFLDAGETVYNPGAYAGQSTTFGFVVPAAQTPGLYTFRIRVYNLTSDDDYSLDFTACENFTDGFFSDEIGEAEDYRFQVVASCASVITSVTGGYVCGSGTTTLTATGTGASGFKWYAAATGGTALATTATGSWVTPSISTTTTYYVTSYSGTCESLVRTAVTATVGPTPTLSFTPGTPTVCGENNVVTLSASGDKETVYLVNEDFEAGTLGVFSNDATNDANSATTKNETRWQNQTSTMIPTARVWFPAVSSGFGPNKFVLTHSDPSSGFSNSPVENSLLLTTSVNSTSYINLTLKLDMFYSRYWPDGTTPNSGGAFPTTYTEDLTVQVSVNGGGLWTTISSITSDVGFGSAFQTRTYNLNAYINQTNLKIRIRNRSWAGGGGWLSGGSGLDNIQLYGEKPLASTFSWTGGAASFSDAACTVPYTPGVSPAITTIYLKPSLAQLQGGDFTFNATTTLSNGCSVTQPITVVNNSKVWQTTGSTDWNTAANWLPTGVPTSTNCVIIPNHTIIPASGFSANAYNLVVKSTGTLDVLTGSSLTVVDKVTVDNNGVFNIENNSSLVQVNNVANTGNINYKRNATVDRATDYVYWGSPVTGQVIDNITTPNPIRSIYTWSPLTANSNGTGGNTSQGTYIGASGSTMAVAKGYIGWPPTGLTYPGAVINSKFTGVPNNGDISFTISRGGFQGTSYTGANGTQITNLSDNYNLTANPYPSSISANQFLVNNSAVIQDGIQVWTHGTSISTSTSSPFYGTYLYNYSANDFLKINITGNNSGNAALDNYRVGSGQAFFVTMLDGATGNAVINFNNSLRSNTYNNSTFFRDGQDANDLDYDNLERHRIWLDIVGANQSHRSLIGYVEGATDGEDTLYDFHTYVAGGVLSMYSLINGSIADIQGKALPFSDQDIVPLGYNAPAAGSYTIAIATVDGLFLGSQKIFIEDRLLNVLHDLRAAPYVFTSEAGINDDRFVLRYSDSYLGTDEFEVNNSVKIVTNERAMVYSYNQNIRNIVVYDILGRKIDSYDNINEKQFTLKNLNKVKSTLIMKITLENGIVVTQKFIF